MCYKVSLKSFRNLLTFIVISTAVKLQGVIVETVILCYVAVKISLTAPLNSGTHYCSTDV